MCVTTETVVRPEDDIRAIACRRNLWEFLFQFVRVFDGDFNTGIFFKLLTDLGQAVIAFVTVNPDDQFAFFYFCQCRGGKHHRCQGRQSEDAGASFNFHMSLEFLDL
ncbi:hypothetical protein D3C75_823440 [compost metagenome]